MFQVVHAGNAKKIPICTELSNSIRPVIFKFWVFNFQIKIDSFFAFKFFKLLKYDNTLPETWEKQNKIIYSSTRYYNYFLSR